jgi:hypothetical protein
MALFKQKCPSCHSRFIHPGMKNLREGDPWYKLTPQCMACPICGEMLKWSRVSSILGRVPMMALLLGGIINLFLPSKEARGDVMEYSLIAMVVGLLLWFAFRKIQIHDCK